MDGKKCSNCARVAKKLTKKDGLCRSCYLKAYRQRRRTQDPSYRPWKSKNSKRHIVTLSQETTAELERAIGRARGRSKFIEEAVRRALRDLAA